MIADMSCAGWRQAGLATQQAIQVVFKQTARRQVHNTSSTATVENAEARPSVVSQAVLSATAGWHLRQLVE